MSDVTQLLEAAAAGDGQAAAAILPLVYDELRKLAAARMAAESPGNTLDATALVHEAYLRLIGDQKFEHRGHFFAAAAEAMRRILVESARRRGRLKRGGGRARVELDGVAAEAPNADSDLVDLDEALTRLEAIQPEAAAVAKLRHFVGLTIEQAAEAQGVSVRKANRDWGVRQSLAVQRIGRDQ